MSETVSKSRFVNARIRFAVGRPGNDDAVPDHRRNGHHPNRRAPVGAFPSEVTGEISFFDRFAGHAAKVASRAPFFALCVLLVLVWAPSYFAFRDLNTWQLIINTATTIVTFLMVALLQNSETRADQAVQHKLNAIADGLADLMEHFSEVHDRGQIQRDIEELKRAVGLEKIESTS